MGRTIRKSGGEGKDRRSEKEKQKQDKNEDPKEKTQRKKENKGAESTIRAAKKPGPRRWGKNGGNGERSNRVENEG